MESKKFTFDMMNSKSFLESSFSNIFDKIILILVLKVALGSALNLVGISFHSFVPILDKDSLWISVFDFWI